MSFLYPYVLAGVLIVTGAAIAGYVALARRRSAAMAAAGLTETRGGAGRHLPYAMLLVALPVLLTGMARPQAEVVVPHVAGTVVLAFDVSNSMSAGDVTPTRLAAAQTAAAGFVEQQPDTVDVGVLMFGDQALLTQPPTDDRTAVLAAIQRLDTGGGTSLGQAILVALGTITGKAVGLPSDNQPPVELGYWPSATIVVFSDGQDTGGPDAQAAAELAASAGVRIQAVGVGTPEGATVEVDGFQLGTALDRELLTAVAQVSGGTYAEAGDAGALAATTEAIDLRLTMEKQPIELTAAFAGAGLLLLLAGSLLGLRRHGRIV